MADMTISGNEFVVDEIGGGRKATKPRGELND